ncbi:MAG: hypothetical protein ACRD2L_24135 [Terriglobia bacterium]
MSSFATNDVEEAVKKAQELGGQVLLPPTALLPSATPSNWTRQQFARAWDIEYPADWLVNDGGIHEGYLVVGGYYGGHTYKVTFTYPIFERPEAMQSLDAWITDEFAFLSPAQRSAVQVLDVTVAGVPAKKVLNLPEKIYSDDGTMPSGLLTHACYIWRRDEKNPSVIRIKQVDGQPFDAAQAEKLLDQFLTGIR